MAEQLKDLGDVDLKRLGVVLHDLCQPLTALQCRLEMAQMIGTEQDYREAIEGALHECTRMSDSVTEMRGLLRRMMTSPGDERGGSGG